MAAGSARRDHASMVNPYWPLTGLRLRVGDLEMRPVNEADLVPLADLLPADVDLDPRLPDLGGGRERVHAGAAVHQAYWSAVGSWRPETWRLPFVALADGVRIGVQE